MELADEGYCLFVFEASRSRRVRLYWSRKDCCSCCCLVCGASSAKWGHTQRAHMYTFILCVVVAFVVVVYFDDDDDDEAEMSSYFWPFVVLPTLS